MIQGFVAGTLAALNSIVAPLGSGHDNVANTFQFAVQNAPASATSCMPHGHDPSVKIKLEQAGEFSVKVNMESHLCSAKQKLAVQKSSFVLPIDVFDNEFLASLVMDRPYILQAVDDPSHPEFKSRLKITRLKPVESTSAQAFLIQWVPTMASAQPEHPPLTVWMKSDKINSESRKKHLALSPHDSAREPSSVTDASPRRSAYDIGLGSDASLLTFPWERFAYSMKKEEVVGQLRDSNSKSERR